MSIISIHWSTTLVFCQENEPKLSFHSRKDCLVEGFSISSCRKICRLPNRAAAWYCVLPGVSLTTQPDLSLEEILLRLLPPPITTNQALFFHVFPDLCEFYAFLCKFTHKRAGYLRSRSDWRGLAVRCVAPSSVDLGKRSDPSVVDIFCNRIFKFL